MTNDSSANENTLLNINETDTVDYEQIDSVATSQDLNENSNDEYIPKFNHQQRMQLEEQLRNHVQLLTQTCLICVDKNEYRNVYDEGLALLVGFI